MDLQYIDLKHNTGHPDYRHLTPKNMKEIEARAKKMAPEPDVPTIPPEVQMAELAEALQEGEGELLGTDKAATPAERAHSERDLERNMARTRPKIIIVQRNSERRTAEKAQRLGAIF